MIVRTTNAHRASVHGQKVSAFPALAARKGHISNLWFFHSPKNNARYEIHGDLAFMHCVLWEGDLAVAGYVPHPETAMVLIDGQFQEIQFGARVHQVDGRILFIDFERRRESASRSKEEQRIRLQARQQAAAAVGAVYYVLTDRELVHKEIRFDNWLNLCSIINRCRGQDLHHEANVLRNAFARHDNVRLDVLLAAPGIDRAQMLAIVAAAFQCGTLHTELDTTLFGHSSVLFRREK